MKKKIRIITIITLLGLISIINLYNAKYLNIFYQNYYLKQLIWYLICFIIFFILNKINNQVLFKYSKYFYYFNLLLLIIVLFWGRTINGSKGWLNLGYFALQPSEFMKITLNLYLIEITFHKQNKYIKLFQLFIYTLLPSILVFLEPDTGAIIFYLLILLICMIPLKINLKYYLLLGISGIIFILLIIYLFIHHQQFLIKVLGTNIFYRADRIINFTTNNYQRDLALLSIFGSSLIHNGLNNILIYIPEGATDFILAFIIGNYGLIFFFIILILYYCLLINLLNLTKQIHNKKTNYLIISFIYLLLLQMMINISMNIGLIPIIGITLPFLSYGGSSLLVNFIYLGIILSRTSMDDLEHSKNKNNWHMDNTD